MNLVSSNSHSKSSLCLRHTPDLLTHAGIQLIPPMYNVEIKPLKKKIC